MDCNRTSYQASRACAFHFEGRVLHVHIHCTTTVHQSAWLPNMPRLLVRTNDIGTSVRVYACSVGQTQTVTVNYQVFWPLKAVREHAGSHGMHVHTVSSNSRRQPLPWLYDRRARGCPSTMRSQGRCLFYVWLSRHLMSQGNANTCPCCIAGRRSIIRVPFIYICHLAIHPILSR